MIMNTSGKTTAFEFTGRGGEYFSIWIVNILLTLITLGIYSAWATVRKRRYFHGNTLLAGAEFVYLATPMMILKGRLIAIAVLILYFGLAQFFPVAAGIIAVALVLVMPWIIWNSMRFQTRMSQYRNVRFDFSGRLKPVIFNLMVLPIIPVLILAAIGVALYFSGVVDPSLIGPLAGLGILGIYLVIPLIQARMANYYVNHVEFGQGKFAAEITSGTYYWTYIKTFLISILIFGAIGYIAFLLLGMEFFTSMQAQQEPREPQGGVFGVIALIYFIAIVFSIWVRAYVGVRIRNYIFDSTSLDDNLQLHSGMKVMGLFGVYFVNAILLIITLGLAYPWTAVRVARYRVNNTFAMIEGSLSNYVTKQQEYQSALGDELGDALDFDMDVAL